MTSRHSRENGNPRLSEEYGFPFPDQVEDRFHGNDSEIISQCFGNVRADIKLNPISDRYSCPLKMIETIVV
jgi:hypothetical protein